MMHMTLDPEVSIILVSFNTRELLKKCLKNIYEKSEGIAREVIVVDNASLDFSSEMVIAEFPNVRLIRSPINLGFAAANNTAFKVAKGTYFVLLNTDAFLHEGALQKALDYIKKNPRIGLGGARLVNSDGSWQPSARLFPSLLNEFLQLSGLADKYPHSSFFGRYNRTWASVGEMCLTDWVPGAFSIIPKKILEEVGYFDERFFLYYEEVDLCKRIKAAGYQVVYWPDVVVTHLGGESSKTIQNQTFSKKEAQLILWRMRSQLLYFRKHHGWWGAYSISSLEKMWHHMRKWKNWNNPIKAKESEAVIQWIAQAWKETAGGNTSPSVPWK